MTLPWMKFWPGAHRREASHLTAAEHGAYFLLQMHAWDNNGQLPFDEGQLQRIASMTKTEWRKSKLNLLAFFYTTDSGLRHHRIDADLENALKEHEQRKNASKLGVEAKALKRRQLEHTQRAADVDGDEPHEGWQELDQKIEDFLAKKRTEKTSNFGLQSGDFNALDQPDGSPSGLPYQILDTRNHNIEEKYPPIVPQNQKPPGAGKPGRRGVCDEAEFETFWNKYPRRVSKGRARRAFAAARRKTDLKTILAALNAASWPADMKFCPHPSTWLNDERWTDQATKRPMSENDRRIAELEAKMMGRTANFDGQTIEGDCEAA